MQQRNRIWRVPPCPWYDVEGMESWLSDMASRGWKLEKETFFLDIATFERAEPASVRYALEAATKDASWKDDRTDNPDAEAIKAHAEDGWEYVARRGQFYIYRNEDAAKREVYRNRQAQAEALEKLAKRRRASLITLTALYGVLYPLARVWKGKSFVVDAANWGLGVVLLPFLIALLWVMDSVWGIVHLQKLAQALQNGGRLSHTRTWAEDRPAFHGKRVLALLLAAVWLVIALRALNVKSSSGQPLSAYAGDPPFATIADFGESDSYKEFTPLFSENGFRRWGNALVKTGIEWEEYAGVLRRSTSIPDDAFVIAGTLKVNYYKARSAWLAQAIAASYRRADHLEHRKEYETWDCPDFGLDYQAAYVNGTGYLCIVFREGNTVVCARFAQERERDYIKSIPLEDWAGIIAESIR